QERALMVIEPPCQARVGRIFEIDDGIYIAVEEAVFKKLRRLVCQAGEFKLGARGVLSFIKAAEESRRSGAVETVVVVENPHPHEFKSLKRGKLYSLTHFWV